jgi:hypothetical protein
MKSLEICETFCKHFHEPRSTGYVWHSGYGLIREHSIGKPDAIENLSVQCLTCPFSLEHQQTTQTPQLTMTISQVVDYLLNTWDKDS